MGRMVNTIGNLISEEIDVLNPRPLIRLRLAEHEARTGIKYNNKQLADFLEVTEQHMSACTNGRAFLRMDKAFKLAKMLGCKVDDLYEYEELFEEE